MIRIQSTLRMGERESEKIIEIDKFSELADEERVLFMGIIREVLFIDQPVEYNDMNGNE
ncbi:hypothetical protein [Paenibacillus crassostreae]|uniref:hypothetical protein n=1 Tax=Paenibacillus crassostreae TaxID=1763538 RepID=UPI000B3122CA|nr:hypothetical protein [Paenibacillus crassostreae]